MNEYETRTATPALLPIYLKRDLLAELDHGDGMNVAAKWVEIRGAYGDHVAEALVCHLVGELHETRRKLSEIYYDELHADLDV